MAVRGKFVPVLERKAQSQRRAIVVSNFKIVFKLDCRTTVDSNVGFNLVVPEALIETSNQSKVRRVRWDNGTIYIIIMYALSLAQVKHHV